MCKAIGLGTVKIRMFDGIVMILNNVRYVPDLKKNLISLATLDSLGCDYSTKDGVTKIAKGFMVIMKGKKIDNLYKLLGNTVTVGPVTARTLLEKARRMRFNARLLENFWVEAVNYACFITNRSPSTTVDFKVQDEV
jgi:hypothetical protein